jgi:hypothetical protein
MISVAATGTARVLANLNEVFIVPSKLEMRREFALLCGRNQTTTTAALR